MSASEPINDPRQPVQLKIVKDTNVEEGGGEEHSEAHGLETADLIRIGFVALAAAAVWFRVWEPFSAFSLIGIVATLVGGYPIFKEAFENIVERKMTMELSMTIALLAALAIREFFTALIITLFVLVAEVLEGLTVGRGRRAIRNLLDFLPRTANVRRDGEWREVSVADIQSREAVLVKPGGRIPVDGIVLDGRSFVEQAAITGESMPAEKMAGSTVYAGTINQSGALEIRAERLGLDTTFGKIIEAVERAERSQAPIQKTADRLAGYLVYFALAAAILTLLITRNIRSTISVVIVAGACGIAAGTPLAILGAIGRAARQGAIIKGGLYLETLAKVDTVVLDKTGTLTYGTPEVSEVRPADGCNERQLIATASIAERRSEHPVARAILRRADSLAIAHAEPDRFDYTPGKGVIAQYKDENIIVGSWLFLNEHGVTVPSNDTKDNGGSEIFVSREGRALGSLRIKDVLRPEAKDAIGKLQSMGIEVVLLSGDTQRITTAVGEQLGANEAIGELLPDAKARWVTELRSQGRKVAMVGDGVNDAPALVQASVGVAMGSGTDVARESADVILIGSDLSKLVEMLRIARRCNRTIMQNFVGTLAVDTAGMALAAVGLLNPLFAVFIHVSSELIFILNSARLLPPLSGQRNS